MKRRIYTLVFAVAALGVWCGSAVADPTAVNGHNCGGFTSTFVPEERLGAAVSVQARTMPRGMTELTSQFANCGANGSGS
jgi:hypothetical protein